MNQSEHILFLVPVITSYSIHYTKLYDMSMPQIILASSSPYRRQLLERLGLPFQVVSPNIDESTRAGESPAAMVERLALAKAHAVAQQRRDALVIGADQVAVHAGQIVGKPRDHAQARRQLQQVV